MLRALALLVLAACANHRGEFVFLCPREEACAGCLSSQPDGSLCKTRWDECVADAPCTAAVPTLQACLCDAASRDARWVCAGDLGESGEKGFNLSYCVGTDACAQQCIE